MARGKWSFHVNRSELFEAQSVAEDLLELSRAHADTIGLILGYYACGVTHMYRGEQLSARANLEDGARPRRAIDRPPSRASVRPHHLQHISTITLELALPGAADLR